MSVDTISEGVSGGSHVIGTWVLGIWPKHETVQDRNRLAEHDRGFANTIETICIEFKTLLYVVIKNCDHIAACKAPFFVLNRVLMRVIQYVQNVMLTHKNLELDECNYYFIQGSIKQWTM